MKALERFREIFWDSFHRPKLLTEKFQLIWRSLEYINDQLAGPFFSIYENGNCVYIYSDQNRFPDINSPDDFLEKCLALIRFYREEIEQHPPVSEEERKDYQLLMYQVDLKMELADLGHQLSTPVAGR